MRLESTSRTLGPRSAETGNAFLARRIGRLCERYRRVWPPSNGLTFDRSIQRCDVQRLQVAREI
jgi:hypothetical protein